MRVLDISIPVSPELPVWPGDPAIVLEKLRAITNKTYKWVAEKAIAF